jgi:hypothetical protein
VGKARGTSPAAGGNLSGSLQKLPGQKIKPTDAGVKKPAAG